MIRIAVAEDNIFLARTLLDTLESNPDIKVKTVAGNGAELMDYLANDSIVDLILMDIEMPVMNGVEATKMVTTNYPHIKVMMLTVFDDDENLFNAICAGANGYLLKDESADRLMEGIHEILSGGAPMTASIALKALRLLRHRPETVEQAEDFQLTDRETQVLEQLCKGLSYSQIAENLIISPKTVRKHIENVYAKLNAHSKLEALEIARKNRLI